MVSKGSIVNRPLDAASSGGDVASDGTDVLTDATDRVASAQAAQYCGTKDEKDYFAHRTNHYISRALGVERRGRVRAWRRPWWRLGP